MPKRFGESRDPMYVLARSGYGLFKAGNGLAARWQSPDPLCHTDELVHYAAAYCNYSVLRFKQYDQLPHNLTIKHLNATDKFLLKLIREFANFPLFTVREELLIPFQQVLACLLQERIEELRMAIGHLLEETGVSTVNTRTNLFFLDLTTYHNAIDEKEPAVEYDLQDELNAVLNLYEFITNLGKEA